MGDVQVRRLILQLAFLFYLVLNSHVKNIAVFMLSDVNAPVKTGALLVARNSRCFPLVSKILLGE